MPKKQSATGSELFIVDNSDDAWKVRRYLHDWCDISNQFDVATGYFDIGALLCLKDEWQKVDTIRILMGDEIQAKTAKALGDALLNRAKARLDESLEEAKNQDDFLTGVPAIVKALKEKKIVCRVYNKNKFHAKAYITHARKEVVGAAALVGSSNFTYAGLNNNVELNVQITGAQVSVLQEWFDEHWKQGKEVSEDVLRVIDKHVRDYSPFEVYARFLHEFFRHYDVSKDLMAWLENKSRVYPELDNYQREAFFDLLNKSNTYRGAFLCDGVGLGKTLVGLMLIEYYVEFLRKRVVLLVPKAANETVWQPSLARFAPHLNKQYYSGLRILNHTDLMRGVSPDGTDYPKLWNEIEEAADMILVDEAHHFRNTGLKDKSNYWKLHKVARNKTLFMLTATPVNNRLIDLQHMIELFTQELPDYFKLTLGINSVPGHFRTLEKALDKLVDGHDDHTTDAQEAAKVLTNDRLFRALVVQRSRGYAMESQRKQGKSGTLFPKREDPKVAAYSLKKTYGKLLGKVDRAFQKDPKPLFSLAIYYPLAFYEGEDTDDIKWQRGRQLEVASLIRTQFLKRFESSWVGFEVSCCQLLLKIHAWITAHGGEELGSLKRWEKKHPGLIKLALERRKKLLGSEEEFDEDAILEEMEEAVEIRDPKLFNVGAIIKESIEDLEQLADFLDELKDLEPEHDDKLNKLIALLKSDPVLSKHKVLVFTEYKATARYLENQLNKAGIDAVDEVDSERANHRDRVGIIQRFSPYYNGTTSKELTDAGAKETRVLVATDILSEGLNLQDATRLINYDLHWNPVRLMQRIGRVDRRLDQKREDAILKDHPEQKSIRGTTAYWNFLPPDDLDELLKLYERVHKKVLRISKTLGIEGKKLLKPQDDYDALRDFNEILDNFGKTPFEDMRRAYNELLANDASLLARLQEQPNRVFSGKAHLTPNTRAVLLCFVLPGPPVLPTGGIKADAPAEEWSEEHGRTIWLMYEVATSKIHEDPPSMMPLLKSEPITPRRCIIEQKTLSQIRADAEKHIKNSHFKSAQAPLGVKPALKAWLELN